MRKLTDGEPNPSNPRSGWTFTAANNTAPTTLAQNPVVTDGTQPHDTILVNNIPVGGAGGMTLAETQQSNYVFAASQCQAGSFPNPADGIGTTTLNLPTITRNSDLYCTYRNKKKGTIELKKDLDSEQRPGPLQPADQAGRDLDRYRKQRRRG